MFKWPSCCRFHTYFLMKSREIRFEHSARLHIVLIVFVVARNSHRLSSMG